VIAFKPQTFLQLSSELDPSFIDINKYINKNTIYYIYGDKTVNKEIDPLHHISHCNHINKYPNVHVIDKYEVDLKKLRDDGTLKKIIKDILS
jgi:hypothetical protein